jgi:hypothetical protein
MHDRQGPMSRNARKAAGAWTARPFARMATRIKNKPTNRPVNTDQATRMSAWDGLAVMKQTVDIARANWRMPELDRLPTLVKARR